MDLLFREHAEALCETVARSESMDADSPEYAEAVREIVRTARRLDLIEALSFPGHFEKEIELKSEEIFRRVKGFYEEIESIEVAMKEGARMLDEPEVEVDGDVLDRIIEHGRLLSNYTTCPPFWVDGCPLGERFPAIPTEELLQQSVLRAEKLVGREAGGAREKSPAKGGFFFEI